MSLYKVGETWYAYVKHKGERVRRSAGTTDKTAAQRFHDELKARLWATAPAAAGSYTWQDACIAWLKAATRSASDRYSLNALNYLDRKLDECTAKSFEDALDGKSPATYNRIKTLINAILVLAREGGHIEKPPKLKRRAEPVKGYRFLTADEWQRLLATLPDHLQAPARFSIATGLRQKNCLGLKWGRVDITRRVVWIEPEETKGKKPIGIPLSDEAVAVLKEQIGKNDEWVFPFKGKGRAEGGPIRKMKTAWHAALERARLGHYKHWKTADGKQHKQWIGDVDWHTFRHTFASWHVMSGTPLEVLQRLGGWSDLRMVQRYAHLAPDYIAGYANNAKPWSPTMAHAVA